MDPRPSCHAVIWEADNVLLVRRAGEPFRGWWGLPGGAVELGETVVEALRREVWEETGLQVDVGPFIRFKDAISREHDSGRVRHHYVILFFLAYRQGGSLRPDSDAAEVCWVPRDRVNDLQLVPGLQELLDETWQMTNRAADS